LLGPADTLVTLTVRRPGRPDDLIFKVVRRPYVPATVHPASRMEDDSPDFFLERARGIAYLRIDTLGRDSPRDLELALKQLQAAGVKALIVDLRFNPGGLLLSSIDVSSRLIPERRGLHMLTRSKEGHQLHAPEKGQRAVAVLDVPLVCLVNGETASGAELIAAELQDYRRAVIIGERTKGKGSVQNISSLDADRQLVLTSALFLRATGKKLDRMAFQGRPADEWGVQPEREVKLTAEETNEVRSHLERMPLVVRDRPPRDPQLEAAIKQLSK
jgi:carboxyl-terminal processing protease